MDINQQVFLVTGGASGLGEATARRLVAGGGRVLIADLNEPQGTALAAELGENARFLTTDVTSASDGEAAVRLALEAFGGLHGLVNCAGIGPPAKAVGRDGPLPLDKFELIIRVNLSGTFNMIRLAAAAMMDQPAADNGERGVIVNTASVAAFDGQIGQPAYSASKAGIVGMTLPLAREFARSGIRVVTIAPGLFMTPMMAGLPEEARASLGAQVPFPARLGQPEEFAALVESIVSNPMLNGETIRLDGAIRMTPK